MEILGKLKWIEDYDPDIDPPDPFIDAMIKDPFVVLKEWPEAMWHQKEANFEYTYMSEWEPGCFEFMLAYCTSTNWHGITYQDKHLYGYYPSLQDALDARDSIEPDIINRTEYSYVILGRQPYPYGHFGVWERQPGKAWKEWHGTMLHYSPKESPDA